MLMFACLDSGYHTGEDQFTYRFRIYWIAHARAGRVLGPSLSKERNSNWINRISIFKVLYYTTAALDCLVPSNFLFTCLARCLAFPWPVSR